MDRRVNVPFSALQVGMTAEIERVCKADDFYVFAHASGNFNPIHLPEEDGDGDGVNEAVAPSMWVGSLISSVLGNKLPGPGTLYLSQTLNFLGRAREGDTLKAVVRIVELSDDQHVRLETWVENASGERIVEGMAEVLAPALALAFTSPAVPTMQVHQHLHFERLLEDVEAMEPLSMAVVAPEEKKSLEGALRSAREKLIVPILVGNKRKIEEVAQVLGEDLDGIQVVDAVTHAQAASVAVKMVNEGHAHALMKGNLHTSELLGHVVKSHGGLRTARRLSHVFVIDVPGKPNLLMITDGAINIAPSLEDKVDIIQNAIELAHSLRIEQPKVGVLSAVETVNTKIPSTLDAAILSKMAERGQIRGGLVDGPLAMDGAIDIDAARTKGIHSLVAGRADILVAPNLESGNILAKECLYTARGASAGVVLGARCPIILTSRADGAKARMVSCAIAVLYHQWQKTHQLV